MNPKQYYHRKGDIVQVRSGIKDADFPDITIGGWVGEITEVDDQSPVTYMITWNEETLRLMHPVFKRRCERDGLDMESAGDEHARSCSRLLLMAQLRPLFVYCDFLGKFRWNLLNYA